MGSTPKYGLPWPEQVEGNDVSDDLRQLAAATEAGLQGSSRLVSQFFTASGTWTKPVGALLVEIEMWGGGAGGSAATGAGISGGGGGGEKTTLRLPASALPSTVSVTVGAAGLAAAAAAGALGGGGGDSVFGNFLRARGGKAGTKRTINQNGDETAIPGVGGGRVETFGQFTTQYLESDTSGGGPDSLGAMFGGGAGGAFSASLLGSPFSPNNGGGTGPLQDGGGTPGQAGTSRSTGPLGGGGGGSGRLSDNGTSNLPGGAGGTPGGGGGGGAGGGNDSFPFSAGGAGARGEVRVYTFCVGK